MNLIYKHWPKLLLLLLICIQIFYVSILSQRPNTIAPEGRVYNVLGKNFYYPSMIRQSKDGSWGIKDTHTTRNTPTVYAQLFFVLAGKIAAFFNIDPISMYQLLRLTGIVSSTVSLFVLIRVFFPERWAICAAALAVLIESGPTIKSVASNIFNLIPAWDVQIIYERRFSLPHHTWGDAFGFMFFFLLFTILVIPKKNILQIMLYSLLLIVSGWWATTILPSFIMPYFFLSLPTIFFVIIRKRISIKQSIILLFFTLLGISLAAIVLKMEFSKGSPWTEWTAEEKSWMQHSTVVSQYIQTLFFYYPFIFAAIIGSAIRFKKMSTKVWAALILSLSWLIGPIPLIFISHISWFPFANFRLVDLHGYAPAGILSAVGLWHILSLFKAPKIKTVIATIIVICIMFVSGITTVQYTKNIFRAQENYWWNIYPSNYTWQGVLFMEKLPIGSNIMVREFFGEMLPAFGPVSSYIGGGHGFRDWPERQWISQHFFKGLLNNTDALALLKNEHITHVFWGPDEKALLQTTNLYPEILKQIFSNQDVTIFEVEY